MNIFFALFLIINNLYSFIHHIEFPCAKSIPALGRISGQGVHTVVSYRCSFTPHFGMNAAEQKGTKLTVLVTLILRQ